MPKRRASRRPRTAAPVDADTVAVDGTAFISIPFTCEDVVEEEKDEGQAPKRHQASLLDCEVCKGPMYDPYRGFECKHVVCGLCGYKLAYPLETEGCQAKIFNSNNLGCRSRSVRLEDPHKCPVHASCRIASACPLCQVNTVFTKDDEHGAYLETEYPLTYATAGRLHCEQAPAKVEWMFQYLGWRHDAIVWNEDDVNSTGTKPSKFLNDHDLPRQVTAEIQFRAMVAADLYASNYWDIDPADESLGMFARIPRLDRVRVEYLGSARPGARRPSVATYCPQMQLPSFELMFGMFVFKFYFVRSGDNAKERGQRPCCAF
jgi:hypothetical protein